MRGVRNCGRAGVRWRAGVWALILAVLCTPARLHAGTPAQQQPAPRDTTPAESVPGVLEASHAREQLQRLMQPRGFTVYIIGDMEGLATVVRNGTEMSPTYRGGEDRLHQRLRQELTDEINAAIAGARSAGATQFVVNDGHGGTLFRNTLPELLDSTAILIRGYPKPVVMETGLNPEIDAIFMIGAHANAGTMGVIAHSFAFDSFTVNGSVLNESGIAAFLGGHWNVPFAMTVGDDILAAETAIMVPGIEAVVVKVAASRSSAITYAPAVVHRMIREGAARAVRRVRSGEIRPLTFQRPYTVRFCMRRTYRDEIISDIARISGVTPDGGRGCFRFVTEDAEAVGTLLNVVEWTVLKPT